MYTLQCHKQAVLKYCVLIRLPQNGKTALHWAASNGDSQMVEMLLRHGANAKSRDNVCAFCFIPCRVLISNFGILDGIFYFGL
jgi:hypothetical protein